MWRFVLCSLEFGHTPAIEAVFDAHALILGKGPLDVVEQVALSAHFALAACGKVECCAASPELIAEVEHVGQVA